ncbi:MAG: ABC transporter ATP-binding protein [Deltaproteobacteria bacterium]|nr:ABC transporter ATP-binding protein [Deltaproteobacteria bacterium]
MIRLVGLEKDYVMGDEIVPALREVNLHVQRGSFVAIMGPSGSGKSTLMNILGCLDRSSRGQYVLDGEDVSDLDDDDLAGIRNRKIGFVFQSFNLLHHATAAENVALPLVYAGAEQQTARALRALEKVALAHRAGHRPAELSGGQRQRVAIARAIITEPPLILADEPTGNLDTRTSEEILAIFEDLHRSGSTIVMVTHERDVAEHAARIVTFRDGRLVSDETVPARAEASARGPAKAEVSP